MPPREPPCVPPDPRSSRPPWDPTSPTPASDDIAVPPCQRWPLTASSAEQSPCPDPLENDLLCLRHRASHSSSLSYRRRPTPQGRPRQQATPSPSSQSSLYRLRAGPVLVLVWHWLEERADVNWGEIGMEGGGGDKKMMRMYLFLDANHCGQLNQPFLTLTLSTAL